MARAVDGLSEAEKRCKAQQNQPRQDEQDKKRANAQLDARDDLALDQKIPIEQLRILDAMLEGMTANKAARLLGLSRATLNKGLHRLRDGRPALVRQPPHPEGEDPRERWEPTEAAILAAPSVKRVIRAYERLSDQLKQERRVLRIGFIRPQWRLLQGALAQHEPKDEYQRPFLLRFHELTSEEQVTALSSGAIDIAVAYAINQLEQLVSLDSRHDWALWSVPLSNELVYSLVVSPKLIDTTGGVEYEALNELCYAALPSQRLPNLHADIATWFESKGIRPADRVESAQASIIATYAGSGRGFGFLPWSFHIEYGGRAKFVKVPELRPEGQIKAYVRRVDRHLLHVLEALRKEAEALQQLTKKA